MGVADLCNTTHVGYLRAWPTCILYTLSIRGCGRPVYYYTRRVLVGVAYVYIVHDEYSWVWPTCVILHT